VHLVGRWSKRHTEGGGGSLRREEKEEYDWREEIGKYVHWHPYKP
jgi:hypothetical protein